MSDKSDATELSPSDKTDAPRAVVQWRVLREDGSVRVEVIDRCPYDAAAQTIGPWSPAIALADDETIEASISFSPAAQAAAEYPLLLRRSAVERNAGPIGTHWHER